MPQEYLIIENNVVTNNVVWDGNTDTWTPPAGSIAIIRSTAPAMIWFLDSSLVPKDFVLNQVIGAGEVGFTWNGTVLTTNQPKPQIPTPIPA